MTAEGWKEAVLEAVRRDDDGDTELLNLLGKLLAECDDAKERLRLAGFGCLGTPWPELVDEVVRQQQE